MELKVNLHKPYSLRTITATQGLQIGIPVKSVLMERTEHRDVRSLQNYQRTDTSSKIDISKKFDCHFLFIALLVELSFMSSETAELNCN